LRDRVPYLGRRPQGTQGVVLVDTRDPEHGHHCVTHELLDGSAMTFEDRAQFRVEPVHKFAEHLGIHVVAQRRGSDQVAEKDGDGLANLGGSR
jgi:hypothetical protein